jgi:hypothetical protein
LEQVLRKRPYIHNPGTNGQVAGGLVGTNCA